MTPDPADRADHTDRAAEGVDHLQAAALEMIGAARAFLDVMEDVVADRDKVADLLGALGTIADAAVHAAAGGMPDGRPRTPSGRGGANSDDVGGAGSSRVQPIRVV